MLILLHYTAKIARFSHSHLGNVGLIILCFPNISRADEVKTFETGLGGDSCANFILALKYDKPTLGILIRGKTYYTEANAYSQWLAGFLAASNWISASNSVKKSREISVDFNGIALSKLKICEEDHAMPISIAASNFVNREAFKK